MVGNARRQPFGWWRTARWSDFAAQTALMRAEARERPAKAAAPTDTEAGWGEPPPDTVLERIPLAD